jgi:hypothetical protein
MPRHGPVDGPTAMNYLKVQEIAEPAIALQQLTAAAV